MKKVLIFLLVLSSSCCINRINTSKEIRIMSWNVQNLFDGIDSGEEYSEFSVENGNWSNELYKRRLMLISSVISHNDPDIIGLQEIEGQVVLDDLQNDYLKEYAYSFSTDTPGAIEIGFLSKYPIKRTGILEVGEFTEGLRPILEIEIEINGERIIIFNNHWKSKSGGFSEPLRLKSAKVLRKRIEIIDDLGFHISLGDFNENHNEYIRVKKSYRTAIMISPGESDYSLEITTSKNVPEGLLYSPWEDGNYPGSYLYRGEAETIDNFFLSRSLLLDGVIFYKSFMVDSRDIFFTQKNNINKWISDFSIGYSDHLPIVLTLGIMDGIKTSIE